MNQLIESAVESKPFFSLGFNVKAFKKAFDTACKALPKRSGKPILTQVKLSCTADGSTLQATNFDVHIVLPAGPPCSTLEPGGSIMLDPAAVKGFFKTVGVERAEIGLVAGRATIRTDHARKPLDVEHDPETFPEAPTWDDSASCWSVPLDEMLYLHDFTAYCVDEGSTRFALGSVLVEFAMDGTGLAIATDGRRLARYTFDCSRESRGTDLRSSFLIPAPTIKLVRDVAKQSGEPVRLQSGPGDTMLFRIGDAIIWARMTEGRFPRYQDVIPDNSEVDATVDAPALLEVIKQAAATNIEPVKIGNKGWTDGEYTLDMLLSPCIGEKDSGASIETLRNGSLAYSRRFEPSISGVGPRFARLDSRYVIDFIESLGRKPGQVRISLIDDKNPIVFRAMSGRLVYVIMPMTVEEKGRSKADYLGKHGRVMLARLEGCDPGSIIVPDDQPTPEPSKPKRTRKPKASPVAPESVPAPEPTDPPAAPDDAPGETPDTPLAAPEGWDAIEADTPLDGITADEVIDSESGRLRPGFVADVIQTVKPGAMTSDLPGTWLVEFFTDLNQAHEFCRRCNECRTVDGIAYHVSVTHDENPGRPMRLADWRREQSRPIPPPVSGGAPEVASIPATFTQDQPHTPATSLPVDSAIAGRSRLARVQPIDWSVAPIREAVPSVYPDGVFDDDGRLYRDEMRAVERNIRCEIRGLVETFELTGDLEWCLSRALLAYSRMTTEETDDFARWLTWIGYKPGFSDYGRLATDEAFEIFCQECLEGATCYQPIGANEPTDPGPDEQGEAAPTWLDRPETGPTLDAQAPVEADHAAPPAYAQGSHDCLYRERWEDRSTPSYVVTYPDYVTPGTIDVMGIAYPTYQEISPMDMLAAYGLAPICGGSDHDDFLTPQEMAEEYEREVARLRAEVERLEGERDKLIKTAVVGVWARFSYRIGRHDPMQTWDTAEEAAEAVGKALLG